MKAKKDGENDQFSVGERQVFESKHREYVGLIQFCSSEGTKCFNSHRQIYQKRSSTVLVR